MSDPSSPLIDLAAETALGATDILVIAAAGAAAALFLGRSVWLKRRRLASGEGCGGCAGCGGACPRPSFPPPRDAPDRAGAG